jgi:hypothetical protein
MKKRAMRSEIIDLHEHVLDLKRRRFQEQKDIVIGVLSRISPDVVHVILCELYEQGKLPRLLDEALQQEYLFDSDLASPERKDEGSVDRAYLSDGKWFKVTCDKCLHWNETFVPGKGRLYSRATGSLDRHQRLYWVPGPHWVLEEWTARTPGSLSVKRAVFTKITDEAAIRWMLQNQITMPTYLAEDEYELHTPSGDSEPIQ